MTEIMKSLKENALIEQAFSKYQTIKPCTGKKHLNDCFTCIGDKLFFWFNTPDHSTHMLKADL